MVSDPGSGEITADFTFSPQDPCVNDPVTFTALAPESDEYLFYWTFSDGVTAFARSSSHAFDDGGDYEVTLMPLLLRHRQRRDHRRVPSTCPGHAPR